MLACFAGTYFTCIWIHDDRLGLRSHWWRNYIGAYYMIVYTKSCLCKQRQKWNELRRLARSWGVPLEERKVTISKEWKQQAASYEIELPFIVNGSQAISFSEPLSRLEKQ
jgi:hypothetical protein